MVQNEQINKLKKVSIVVFLAKNMRIKICI